MPSESAICEVVVIGGGIAGLIAAVRVAQSGRRVIVLEKQAADRYVCNTRLSAGVWHCCGADILSDPEDLERRVIEVTAGYAQADLAQAVARDGVRVVRWMQDLGIRFIKGPFAYQSFVLAPPSVTARGHQWEGRGADVMLRTLESALVRQHGRLSRGHRATDLILHDGGVRGVRGENNDGRPFEIASGAVVIADGGFQSNGDLLRQFISPRPEQVFQRNAGTGMGDGLRMAQSAGAGVTDLSGFYGHVLSRDAFRIDKLWPYPYLDAVVAAGIIVNSDGGRFTDEGLGGIAVANAIASSADPSGKLVIADTRIWAECGATRLLSPNPALIEGGGTVFKAHTLEALARECGLNPDRLVALIEQFNTAVATGKTARLQPCRSVTKAKVFPIEVAPFYAFPVAAGISYTMGGIRINAAGQALNEDGTPIASLYAAGCATGGIEGGPSRGYVGGLLKSSVTALRAAEHLIEAGSGR